MMSLEEYWIGFVQKIVGRDDLQWFDRIAKKKEESKFEDFQFLVTGPGVKQPCKNAARSRVQAGVE